MENSQNIAEHEHKIVGIVFFVPGLQPIFQQGLHHLVQTEQVYTDIRHQPDLTHGGRSRCRGLAAAL